MPQKNNDHEFYIELDTKLKDETCEFYVKPQMFETEQLKGYKNPTKKADGIFIANSTINLSNLKTMSLRGDDVLLIGFPKSGKF